MEPKPIDPQDIRVGMRVRRTFTHESGRILIDEFTVRAVNGGAIDFDEHAGFAADHRATWTLLADAPTPQRETGSRWRDPENNVRYIVADDGSYLPYTYSEQGLSSLQPGSPSDAKEIARLTPIPAFDPAVLWPDSVVGERTCQESEFGANKHCTRPNGHDGLHAAYGSRSEPPSFVWGDPR